MSNDNLWDEALTLEVGFRVARCSFLENDARTAVESYLWALETRRTLFEASPVVVDVMPDVQAFRLTEAS